jgi:high-affinity iron transporter
LAAVIVLVAVGCASSAAHSAGPTTTAPPKDPVGTIPPPVTATSVVPLHDWDFTRPVATYRASIALGLASLATATDTLQATVGRGDLTGARSQWLAAHLDYERLGAAYDAFGDYDQAINGRADGLPGHVANPGFTGFRRVEYDLWHGASGAAVLAATQQLDRSVHALQQAFPTLFLNAPDLPLRAHEILENALEFELTGETDEGSGTNLATVQANIDGTRILLAALSPLLDERAPALAHEIQLQLTSLSDAVDAHHHADGSWDPVETLSQADRELIDSRIDAALEHLAEIPFILPLAQT